jgi:peptide/nickel transport system permease protein
MGKYIIRRALQAIPVIFLIAVVSFLLMQAAPGGPAAAFNQNPRISEAQKAAWLERWCLEAKPDLAGTLREFGGWMGVWNCEGGASNGSFFNPETGLPNFLPQALGGGNNGILHGDFGFSIFTGRPVLDMISERVPATLVLMTTAFIIWVTVAIVIGVIAAVRRYSLFDQAVTFFSYVFYSLPTFWLGLILIFIFAVGLRWVPPQGIVDTRGACGAFNTPHYWDCFWKNPAANIVDIGRHLILPVITLVAVSVAGDSRFVRSSMLDTLSQDYVRTARAKGLTRSRVVFRHAFRNALLPIMTNVALEIAFLFSGAIVTETVFNWPGMGRLYIDGVANRDYFLLMGILLIGSVLVVVMNLVADVFYAWADPRIRY